MTKVLIVSDELQAAIDKAKNAKEDWLETCNIFQIQNEKDREIINKKTDVYRRACIECITILINEVEK